MSDASLLYLQLIPVEQKGWLTLRIKDQQPSTTAAVIGHISQNSIVVLSSWQTVIPVEKIIQAEFRYVDHSGIYTVLANHLEAQLSPNGGLRLTITPPLEMTHRQQRNFIRIEPEEKVRLSFTPLYPDDYASGEGIMKDMSGSGLRFVTDEFVHKDSILKISFPLPESDDMIHAVAQVVRKEFVNEQTITSVRFLDLEPSKQKKIIAYCVSEQLKIAQNQIKQKRKFARVSLHTPLPVQIRAVDHMEIHQANILNLGGGGMLIHSQEVLVSSPLYHLTFQLSDAQTITAFSKVAEKTIAAEWAKYHMEFVDIEPRDQERIVDFVLEQQLSLMHEPDVSLSHPR